MRSARDSWVNPALALALCALAASGFAALRIPLPWMTGPLLAMAMCNFAGARLRSAAWGRPLGQVVIGTALGVYFTPTVGGVAEMCITAKVLQLGVPLVTVAHVVRVLVLMTTTGPLFRVASAAGARLRMR